MLQTDSSAETDSLKPYLRAANIQWDGVDITDIKSMWFSPRDIEQLQLKSGDLLISEGGDVGRSAVWGGELNECYIQNSVNRVRARVDDSTRFLYYWMATIKAKGYVDVLCNKSTIAHFTAEKVAEVPTPFPPPAEQTAIATFLDRETAKIDALIAEQEKLLLLLAEKRQATISHAVTKGLNPEAPMKDSGVEWLGEVPAHWCISRIKHVVAANDGIQMGPFGGMLLDLAADDTGFKVYGQENTISGDFSRGNRWISKQRFEELKRYSLQDGDMVLTRKGSLGNARLVRKLPQPGICDSDTIRVRVNDQSIRSEFLTTLLHEADYVAYQLTFSKRGAILSGVNTETIANLCVVVPPAFEQQEILNVLKTRLAEFVSVVESVSNAIALLKERRAALISAAVTGKIDVRNIYLVEASCHA